MKMVQRAHPPQFAAGLASELQQNGSIPYIANPPQADCSCLQGASIACAESCELAKDNDLIIATNYNSQLVTIRNLQSAIFLACQLREFLSDK